VAIDFGLAPDIYYRKSGISNVTLPATGWSIGVWVTIKNFDADQGFAYIVGLNDLLPPANGATTNDDAINMFMLGTGFANSVGTNPVALNNRATLVASRYAGIAQESDRFSSAALTPFDGTVKRLFVLAWTGTQIKSYIVPAGTTATPDKVYTAAQNTAGIAIPITSVTLGTRYDLPANRDWYGDGGQLFLLGKALTDAQVTALASGTQTISDVIATGGSGLAAGDLLGHWAAETRAATLTDLSPKANNLNEGPTTGTTSAFNFVNAPVNTTISEPAIYGDVDLVLSNVVSGATTTPTVNLFGDPEFNTSPVTNWHNLIARVNAVNGKTPIFTIQNLNEWRGGAATIPQRGWKPWWRAVGAADTAWTLFSSMSQATNILTFSNTTAFSVSDIEIAFYPPYNIPQWNSLFDAAYASGFGFETPEATTYRTANPTLPAGSYSPGLTTPLGSYALSPAGTSADGFVVPTIPMRMVRVTSADALASDGQRKRRHVVLCGTHAQEDSGDWVADRLLRTLIGASADAVALRRNNEFWFEVINYSGQWGQNSRGVLGGQDPNRDFANEASFVPALTTYAATLPEVIAVQTMLANGIGTKAESAITLHSDFGGTGTAGIGEFYWYTGASPYYSGSAANTRWKDVVTGGTAIALVTAGDGSLDWYGVANGNNSNIDVVWAAKKFGCQVWGAHEHTFSTANYIADSQAVADQLILGYKTLYNEGFFAVATGASVVPSKGSHAQTATAATLNTAGAASIVPSKGSHAQTATAATLNTAGPTALGPVSGVHLQSAGAPSLTSSLTGISTFRPPSTRTGKVATISRITRAV
jgi:hypothetical protein